MIEKIKHNPEFKDKVFFPNIELRLDINTSRNSQEVNIHLIFDNNCETNLIKKFLSYLETTSTKGGDVFYSCEPKDLQELGYDKASVSLKSIRSALRKTFGTNKPYLKVGTYRGHGGFIYGVPEKQGESQRKKVLSDEVDKFCDFVFGTEKDKKWFSKLDRYENKDIKSPAKPVIATSDCHNLADCKNRLGKKDKMTWIKADKTFEGLRQILFEPEDRINFEYSNPEIKKPYFMIDKVRFIDNSGSSNFMSEFIEINQNLTTIIGGKSTGKSLLLYYISKTIDSQEVNLRFSNHSLPMKYDFDDGDCP